MTPTIRRLSLSSLAPRQVRSLTTRHAVPNPSILADATAIVADVAARGDAALRHHGAIHGGQLANGTIAVNRQTIAESRSAVDPDLLEAMEHAIANVTAVHASQRPLDTVVTPGGGITIERVWTPLASVGAYVPGGRGLYPSSLIMGVVPARIAGVGRIVVATPARPDGTVDPVVLAAAALLDVDAVYAMGGAQAVGALAYGTESVEAVDKIVGPGGPWVTAAKLAVFGAAGIDLPAGPSEAAVLVDASADPAIVAADVMCQAEHGEESAVALIVVGDATADAVVEEIGRQLPTLERADTIGTALSDHGMVVVADDLQAATAFANAWAPEHLSVHTDDAGTVARDIPNAGSVFVGHWTPEAAGDYATGANHVLPTGGLARAYGPLCVEDFGSWRQIQTLTRQGLEALAPTITRMANAEGFTAHAHSVLIRLRTSA